MSNPDIARVLDFCATWARRDTDAVMAFLAPDCFFHNMPIAPARGHAEIRPMLAGFMGMSSLVEFRVANVAQAANGTVLVERTDRFEINGVLTELPVVGAFELRDGLIAVWRDYYDQRTLEAALAASGVPTGN